MRTLVFFILIVMFILCGWLRLLVCHLPSFIFYAVKDFYLYIKNKKWQEFNYFGIDIIESDFGKGKTLYMSMRAKQIYETFKSFGKEVRIISNYHLNDIPYIPLKSFEQICDLADESNPDNLRFAGTLVLFDEVQNSLSARNFANFPMELCTPLTQQRKCKVYIMASCQRIFMVDKIFRSLATHTLKVNKLWRFLPVTTYDSFDYENAVNQTLLQPIRRDWFIVRDKHYKAYDTHAMISKDCSKNFISNMDALERKGLANQLTADINIAKKPSRKGKKLRK